MNQGVTLKRNPSFFVLQPGHAQTLRLRFRCLRNVVRRSIDLRAGRGVRAPPRRHPDAVVAYEAARVLVAAVADAVANAAARELLRADGPRPRLCAVAADDRTRRRCPGPPARRLSGPRALPRRDAGARVGCAASALDPVERHAGDAR